jgi:hypothetical protein
MSDYRIVILQTHASAQAQAGASAQPALAGDAVPAVPTGDQLREQIRQTIQAATQAATESRDMQQAVRDAERHVRDAERQLREARTDEQRSTAQLNLIGARAELSGLQGATRITTVHTEPPMRFGTQDMIPPQVVDISIAFFIMLAVIIIGWPLARAMGRRLERRADAPALPDPAITGQLQRIEQAVEAMSIEIERISESQRFIAKLQNGAAERAPLGAGERR